MNDSPFPPPSPEPSPFGAGVPTESIEPVRLPPGLGSGPALDIRGSTVSAHESAASATTAPAALAPQPFVGWIIPAASGASGASTPPATSLPAFPISTPVSAQSFPPPPTPVPTPSFATSSSTASAAPSPGPAAEAASSSPPSATSAPGFAAQAASNTPTPPPAPTPLPPAAKPPRRWWIAIAHLAYLIPFPPGVLVTAAVWIWRRSRDPLMADQGREALNMQLTFWLAMGLLGATCVASPLVPFVYVLGAVLCILAAIASWSGDRHRYPWVFRFLT